MVDDASLDALKDALGRWPWPRMVWGEVSEYLRKAGARDIVFDILFTERTIGGNDLGPGDLALVGASGNGTEVVHSMQLVSDSADEVNASLLGRPLPSLARERFSLKAVETIGEVKIPSHNNFYLPFPELLEFTPRLGVVEFASDPDGVYRRTPLLRRYGDAWFPTLPLAIFAATDAKLRLEPGKLLINDMVVPLDDQQNFLVNIHQNFPIYSVSGILASIQNKGKSQFFTGEEFLSKTVFIGVSAVGAGDIKTTPLGPRTPGVYLQAATLDNLRRREFLSFPPFWVVSSATWILNLVAVGSILLVASFWVQIAGSAALMALTSIGGYLAFGALQLVLPLSFVLVSLGSAVGVGFLYQTFTEGREKRKVRKMLSQYVSPVVLKEVMDKRDGVSAEVGGKENMSVLFSDVRGFTSLSERLKPEQVVEMLNYYLNEMVDAVFQHRGTLDKFVGDAVMAFWGAPIRDEKHPLLATRSAIEMIRRLALVNEEFAKRKWPKLEIGVGIHTGEVILGNIGSEKKLDYTVIGDNVNLSSRVQGLTKTYHAQLLISESTYERVKSEIPCKIIDRVCVKGKKLPIAIYAPIIEGEESVEDYQSAFDAYLAREFEKAEKAYKELALSTMSRGSIDYCGMMAERCREYMGAAPPEDWDGSYVMTSK